MGLPGCFIASVFYIRSVSHWQALQDSSSWCFLVAIWDGTTNTQVFPTLWPQTQLRARVEDDILGEEEVTQNNHGALHPQPLCGPVEALLDLQGPELLMLGGCVVKGWHQSRAQGSCFHLVHRQNQTLGKHRRDCFSLTKSKIWTTAACSGTITSFPHQLQLNIQMCGSCSEDRRVRPTVGCCTPNVATPSWNPLQYPGVNPRNVSHSFKFWEGGCVIPLKQDLSPACSLGGHRQLKITT